MLNDRRCNCVRLTARILANVAIVVPLAAVVALCGCGSPDVAIGEDCRGLPERLFATCRDGRVERLRVDAVAFEDYVYEGKLPLTEDEMAVGAAEWEGYRWAELEASLKAIRETADYINFDWRKARLIRADIRESGNLTYHKPYERAAFVGDRAVREYWAPHTLGGTERVEDYVLYPQDHYLVTLEIASGPQRLMVFWSVRNSPNGPRILGNAFAAGMAHEDVQIMTAMPRSPEECHRFAKTIVTAAAPPKLFISTVLHSDLPPEGLDPVMGGARVFQLPESIADDRIDELWEKDKLSISGWTRLTETSPTSRVFEGTPLIWDQSLYRSSVKVEFPGEGSQGFCGNAAIDAVVNGKARRLYSVPESVRLFRTPSRDYSYYRMKIPMLVLLDRKSVV